jgi:secreted Zn-dependent insulinase-like peptidase
MWDEVRAVSATKFRFQQKASAYSYATDMAAHLHLYEDEHVLSAGQLFDPMDMALFDK